MIKHFEPIIMFFFSFYSFRLRGEFEIAKIGETGALEAPKTADDFSIVNLAALAIWSKVDLKLNNLSLEKKSCGHLSVQGIF